MNSKRIVAMVRLFSWELNWLYLRLTAGFEAR